MADNIFELWDKQLALPTSGQLAEPDSVTIHIIKKHEPDIDGYQFLHGVVIARHQNTLYSSWAHNKGIENTDSEVVQGSRSFDGGKTWTKPEMIAEGRKGEGISHGVFLNHDGMLWAFLPHFTGIRENVRAHAYRLNDQAKTWDHLGCIGDQPFWPLGEPQLMANGCYIMSGAMVGGDWGADNNPAAVAISRGQDLSRWDFQVIPKPANMIIWGESTVIVQKNRILNLSRYWRDHPVALVSESFDYGQNWSMVQVSNLPMTDAKPYAGRLSTGQNYLVCTTSADCGINRFPLTIALSKPGEQLFSKIYKIRDGYRPDLGDQKTMALSYPYAIELDGLLYIAYSCGKGMNLNSAELAIIPVESLAVMP